MPKHHIELEETITYRVEIEAASELEARQKIQELLDDGEDGGLEADEIDSSELRLVKPVTGWHPDSHWDEHPDYPCIEWQQEVGDDNTRQSYIEWVNSQIELEDDE